MRSSHTIVRYLILLVVLGYCILAPAKDGEHQLQLVSFQSGEETLQGYLWVPKGDGPFRAVVWSYGHGKPLLKQGSPSRFAQLSALYVDRNYVLFIPDRTVADEKDVSGKKTQRPTQRENDDLIAAVTWLRTQTFVDASRVAVSGMLSGAMISLFAIERDATIRAAVLFSPASHSWDSSPELQETSSRATDSTPVPIFLCQPQDDMDLGPSEVLGRKLKEKGGLNRAKIYPPFSDPKSFGIRGVQVWGNDVLKFLDAAMNESP